MLGSGLQAAPVIPSSGHAEHSLLGGETEMKKTYWEKLKDPRWQRMRLAVMERDGFACQMCLDDKSTLNVHHRIYRKGADPWGYQPHELVTLCEACHDEQHQADDSIKEAMCLASVQQIPAGRIAALIYGFVYRDAEMGGDIDGDIFDKLTPVAEEFPSAFLAGKEAFDRMMSIAIEMGPMKRG